MTDQEKSDFTQSVYDAKDVAEAQLLAKADAADKAGETEKAAQYRQSLSQMRNASIDFQLDTYGPKNAQMTFGNSWPGGDQSLEPGRTVITVYKGAFEGYMFGSRHSPGYSVDLPAGFGGLVAMVTHESGHGVVNRNFYRDSNGDRAFLRNREALADDWVNQTWDDAFR